MSRPFSCSVFCGAIASLCRFLQHLYYNLLYMCGGRVNGSAGEGLCSVACALRQDQRGLTSGSNCASICTLVCCPSTTDSFMNWPTSTRRPSPTSNAPYYEFSRRRSVTLSPTGCEVLWWVCMSVCLSVCLLAYLRKHTFEHQQIFRSSPERWPNKPGKNVRPSVCPSVHPYIRNQTQCSHKPNSGIC